MSENSVTFPDTDDGKFWMGNDADDWLPLKLHVDDDWGYKVEEYSVIRGEDDSRPWVLLNEDGKLIGWFLEEKYAQVAAWAIPNMLIHEANERSQWFDEELYAHLGDKTMPWAARELAERARRKAVLDAKRAKKKAVLDAERAKEKAISEMVSIFSDDELRPPFLDDETPLPPDYVPPAAV